MALQTWQIVAVVFAMIILFNPGGMRDKITSVFEDITGTEFDMIEAPTLLCYVEDTTLTIFFPGELFVNDVSRGYKEKDDTYTVLPGDNIIIDAEDKRYFATVPCAGRISSVSFDYEWKDRIKAEDLTGTQLELEPTEPLKVDPTSYDYSVDTSFDFTIGK